jgi:hypothetical protein
LTYKENKSEFYHVVAQLDNISCDLPLLDLHRNVDITGTSTIDYPLIWRNTMATLMECTSQLLLAFLQPEAAFSANLLVMLTRHHW